MEQQRTQNTYPDPDPEKCYKEVDYLVDTQNLPYLYAWQIHNSEQHPGCTLRPTDIPPISTIIIPGFKKRTLWPICEEHDAKKSPEEIIDLIQKAIDMRNIDRVAQGLPEFDINPADVYAEFQYSPWS